jgi:hypothetical protein
MSWICIVCGAPFEPRRPWQKMCRHDKEHRNARERWRYKHNHLRFRDRTLRRMRKRYRDDAAFRARCNERGRRYFAAHREQELARSRAHYWAKQHGD